MFCIAFASLLHQVREPEADTFLMSPRGSCLISLLLFSLLPLQGRATTIYVPTKEYAFEYGEPPMGYDTGLWRIRAWLEEQPAPRLRNAPLALRRATRRKFELGPNSLIRFAVLGPPRVTNGKSPVFYAWIEWVSERDLVLDLDQRRKERKAGIAKIVIEGMGEKNLDLRAWYPAEELEHLILDESLPMDAAVVSKKMADLHSKRPRHINERVNGPGKTAPY